ncbi:MULTISPECIES: PH domain-containing protein [Actinoalloteichus]|uniref:Membrane protein n=1 Tax=Actinoalloteichus fjordicus TaxID=1612552 RepID=A0AAC9PUY7_9PSEU|nr:MULTISPECIES: PH domain-containing protein [Actinoalloteichus]APU17436.1 putative membrane protein [Actinoalloteichus fjordicus]APU23522.1 putative membrane protein [Actinoalloteichus sp. GBA129-24]
MTAADERWHRIDPRTPVVSCGYLFALVLPVTALLIYRGVPGWIIWLSVAPPTILIPLYEVLRARMTRYRVADGRFELRKGVVFRSRRSVSLDRVRSVDATAEPLGRLLGVTSVRIGTGENVTDEDSALRVFALGRSVAHELRAALLPRQATERQTVVLARWEIAWLRFAPFSFVNPLLGLAAFGGGYELLDMLGVDVDGTVIPAAFATLAEFPLWLSIGGLVLLALAIGTVAAVALYVESWWRHRLTLSPAAIQVRRGLLTTRNITLERSRLIGVQLREPLSLRWAGAASVRAVATGLGRDDDEQSKDRSTLLPPVRWSPARQVAARIIGREAFPVDAVDLRPHPRAARRRRIGWALAGVAAPLAVLLLLGVLLTDVLLHIGWWFAGFALPVALLLALDAYRSLGHAHDAEFLVSRKGSVSRCTTALRRTDVIGVTISRSPFQRRSSLINLTATIAGGNGAYRVPDTDQDEGLEFARHAVGGLITPFLIRD